MSLVIKNLLLQILTRYDSNQLAWLQRLDRDLTYRGSSEEGQSLVWILQTLRISLDQEGIFGCQGGRLVKLSQLYEEDEFAPLSNKETLSHDEDDDEDGDDDEEGDDYGPFILHFIIIRLLNMET